MGLEGWANASTGDVDAPTGYVERITNTEPELLEIHQAFEEEAAELSRYGFRLEQILGSFLIKTTSDGFVHVTEYPSHEALVQQFERIQALYNAWLEGGEAPTLRDIELHGKSLANWHRHLCTDAEGEPTGHLLTPGSRYGDKVEDCAWYALAAQWSWVEAGGDTDEFELGLEWFMRLAVNDSADVARLIREHGQSIPQCLLDRLDEDVIDERD